MGEVSLCAVLLPTLRTRPVEDAHRSLCSPSTLRAPLPHSPSREEASALLATARAGDAVCMHDNTAHPNQEAGASWLAPLPLLSEKGADSPRPFLLPQLNLYVARRNQPAKAVRSLLRSQASLLPTGGPKAPKAEKHTSCFTSARLASLPTHFMPPAEEPVFWQWKSASLVMQQSFSSPRAGFSAFLPLPCTHPVLLSPMERGAEGVVL